MDYEGIVNKMVEGITRSTGGYKYYDTANTIKANVVGYGMVYIEQVSNSEALTLFDCSIFPFSRNPNGMIISSDITFCIKSVPLESCIEEINNWITRLEEKESKNI